MIESKATRRFWKAFAELPAEAQQSARTAFKLFRNSPAHPGLHFKKLEDRGNLYSVRIGLGYRAVGVKTGDEMVWFWIGSHADYDRMTK